MILTFTECTFSELTIYSRIVNHTMQSLDNMEDFVMILFLFFKKQTIEEQGQ
jgi:hypothetical protein